VERHAAEVLDLVLKAAPIAACEPAASPNAHSGPVWSVYASTANVEYRRPLAASPGSQASASAA
jgi:hypothetical protein